MLTITKTCTKCGEAKDLSFFNKQKAGKFGVNSWCRPCFKIYNRKYRAENLDRERSRSRKWANENKDKIIAAIYADRKRRPEHFREYFKKRRRENTENIKAIDKRRRAKRLAKIDGDELSFGAVDWKQLMSEHDYRCFYCGKRSFLTQDHIEPLSRGGSHTYGNILPACGPCNNSKNASTLEEWMQRRPLFCDVWDEPGK